jgi:hypothetical protein
MSDPATSTPRSVRFPLTPARARRLIVLTLAVFVATVLRAIALFLAENQTPVIIDGEPFTPIPVPVPVLVAGTVIVALIYGIVLLGLLKHKEWSRTLGTIITGAAVLGGAGSALGFGNPITTPLVLGNVLVMGTGIVWIYVAWWNRRPQK